MDSAFLNVYIVISLAIAAMDILLATKSVRKNNTTGRYLGYACAGAAVVDISYLISILNDSYMCMSIMSSIYFASIDLMLMSLLVFAVFFTQGKFSKTGKMLMRAGAVYTLFEIVVFAINPFYEIAIHYVPRDTAIAKYSYEMMPLYWMHLIFSYSLVTVTVILIIVKICKVPREYRLQYNYVVLGIVAIVAVNAVFLFLPGENVYNLLDYSICGYSLTSFLLYWSCFNYSTHGMLNRLKNSIFENIGQGIVLFDYDDNLILHNERAVYLLGGLNTDECSHMRDFLKYYNIALDFNSEDNSFSLQCYIKNGEQERPLRCDIRKLINKKGQKVGQMFVFSDAALETDLLTGFQNWESFKRLALEEKDHFTYPVGVAICDINSLSVINSTMGNQVGNQKIKMLAETMRQCFPSNTYYVRGVEANLIALCGNVSEDEMQECLSRVRQQFDGNIQCAVCVATEENPDIIKAIQTAAKAMRAKKLVDKESIHSEMLTSLIRALEECDSDTEHHVKRTQNLGAELGRRIELTDIQQSRLSLLCLLHDIGKIGIPLEILNKPGKLSDDEWNIMRTHTEKGFEIAHSNKELEEIAEDIRHHHERWDGKGYPDGLSRESIPLLSRVIAVVDAFDAMTNDRCYRHAMPVSKALEELKRCAGTQFDPYIVSEFISMFKENDPDVLIGKSDDKPFGETTQQYNGGLAGMPASEPVNEDEEGACVHPIPYSRYLLDGAMKIVWIDENFEKMTGYSMEDVEKGAMTQGDLIPEEERTEYMCQTNSRLAKSNLVFLEHKIRRKDGEDIYVFCCGRVYYDSSVRSQRAEIIITEISHTYAVKRMMDAEQSKAEARLRHWEGTYRRDSLTGLLNHAAFRSDMEMRIMGDKGQAVMIMMDVDKFKEYNDTYGHLRGDNYLILVAQTLLMSVGKEDCVCRMGGDEFAAMVFFDKGETKEKMHANVQKIFDEVNNTVKSAKGGTSVSMGAAVALNGETFNELYDRADKALYHAKNNGRGRLAMM